MKMKKLKKRIKFKKNNNQNTNQMILQMDYVKYHKVKHLID